MPKRKSAFTMMQHSTLLLAIVLLSAFTHALHLVPRQALIYSQDELDHFPWSQTDLTLECRGHLYVYHNYTLADRSFRYLAREIIPHHRRVIRSHIYPAGAENHLTERAVNHSNERGVIINPDVGRPEAIFVSNQNYNGPWRMVSWKWLQPAPYCPVRIELCFQSTDTKDKLKPFVDAAIDKWHRALGPKRGVQFAYTQGVAQAQLIDAECRSRNPAFGWMASPDAVEVRINSHGHYGVAGPGWMPGRQGGRMWVTFDPEGKDRQVFEVKTRNYIDAQMAHELGHVLGLIHEHQRYDAARYIDLNIDNLLGIERLGDRMQAFENHPRGRHLARDMMTSDVLWTIKMDDVLGSQPGDPVLGALVPYVRQNDPRMTVDNMEIGQFDWDSIMLYTSWSFGRDGTVTLRKRNDGTTWGRGGSLPISTHFISNGDRSVVRRMYPDLS